MRDPKPSFDLILHLAGEQPLPLYIGLRQFDCSRHVIACTEKTAFVADAIRDVLPATVRIEPLAVQPYDIRKTAAVLQERVQQENGARWAFNLTGGTKPMFAAALRVAAETIPAFYVETSNRTLSWLGADMRKEPLRSSVETVRTFVRLAGYKTNEALSAQLAKIAAARTPAVEACWKHRRHIEPAYRRLSDFARHPGVPFLHGGKGEALTVELQGPESQYAGKLRLGGQSFEHGPWPDLAAFIVGGWFEEFVWTRLGQLKTQGSIGDLELRLLPTREDDAAGNPVQEFDVAFTDGYGLTLVECKAGEVGQDHIQKLENLARNFGGHFGRGVLVYAQPEKIERATAQRIRDSAVVAAVSGEEISKDVGVLLRVKPGEIVGECGRKPRQGAPRPRHR